MINISQIIFLHGIGLDISVGYWKEWASQLIKELKKQGVVLTPYDFDGIYYADIFSSIDKSDSKQEEERVKFILQLKNHVRKEMLMQMSFYNRGVINDFVNEIILLFGQMFYYFYNDEVYRAVNNRIYKKILSSKYQVHLIGFSLGSLAGFCSLQQRMELTKKIKNFIMVGSPMFWLQHGMSMRCDLKSKPTMNYFTNVSGRLDIAWPQMVPYIVRDLNENVNTIVNKINPIEGHMSYFHAKDSVVKISKLIKKYI